MQSFADGLQIGIHKYSGAANGGILQKNVFLEQFLSFLRIHKLSRKNYFYTFFLGE